MPLKNLTEWIQFIVSTAAILFAIGFAIINARLSSYGVSELAPLSPRYVAVGLLFLIFMLAAFLVRHAASVGGSTLLQRLPKAFQPYLAGVLVFVAVVTIELGLYAVLQRPTLASLAPVAATLLGWNFVAAVGFALLPIVGRGSRIRLSFQGPGRIALSVVGFPLLFLALTSYARGPFGYFPIWIGGGQAEPARIMLNKDGAAVCPECATDAVEVLAQDGDRLILLLRGSGTARVLEIPTSIVLGVEHTVR